MISHSIHHPNGRLALFESLYIPREPLRAHQWITAGVPANIINQLAELVMTDASVICDLAGISRSTITRRLKADTPLSTDQGARMYGVVQVLDAVLSLHGDDTIMALSWLRLPARGLGGSAPAEMLTTPIGVQAVIDLVGRIEFGVCQ